MLNAECGMLNAELWNEKMLNAELRLESWSPPLTFELPLTHYLGKTAQIRARQGVAREHTDSM